MTNKDATRFASQTQEDRIAKKLGGSRNANSGAGKWNKSDVSVKNASTLIECKTCMTEKDSFSIKKDWLRKAKEEAYEMRLSNFALAFNFLFTDKEDWYIIDDRLMRFLIDKLAEENDNGG